MHQCISPTLFTLQAFLLVSNIAWINCSVAFNTKQSSFVNFFAVREQCLVPSDEPFFPNAPAVTQYASCNGLRVELPENRQALDFPSVFQFVADHTICRFASFSDDCTQRVTISIPYHLYRFCSIGTVWILVLLQKITWQAKQIKIFNAFVKLSVLSVYQQSVLFFLDSSKSRSDSIQMFLF